MDKLKMHTPNLADENFRNTVYADILEAQVERMNGHQGRSARDVLSDMKRAIAEAKIGE